MGPDQPILFALQSSRALAAKVAAELGVSLAAHEERDFEDGEHKARPLINVRGRDAFVFHSLHGDQKESANDKLCRLLFFVGALKDASARRVTAVVPYLAYARKDRKTKSRDPVTTRYIAALFEAVGADHVVTMEVHNLAAFQNSFRCATDHLDFVAEFAGYFASLITEQEIAVVSPDAGGVKRANRFREALKGALDREVAAAFVEKYRSSGVVSGGTLVGDVENRVAIIVDDLISTGTTLVRAAWACREQGATRVFAVATHGLFVGDANKILSDPVLEKVVTTNTIPPFRLDPAVAQEKLVELDCAPLFAEAIKRIQTGGSIEELLEG